MKQLTKDYFPKYTSSSCNSKPEKQITQLKSRKKKTAKQIFLQRRQQMANKHMKSCSTLLNIGKTNTDFDGEYFYLISDNEEGAFHYHFSSLTQVCPVLCELMNCSTLSFLVHHLLLELTQTHVHQVSDAIQPSHPLSSPSLSAFNLSQHQGHFQCISSLHQVAKVLDLQV